MRCWRQCEENDEGRAESSLRQGRVGRARVFKFSDLLRELAPSRVVLPEPDGVRTYLEENADLAGLLPSVVGRLRGEVGGEAELALDVYRDAETEDHYLTLY